jgi:UDP-N-acetylglucosamine transferase subunit ALG13
MIFVTLGSQKFQFDRLLQKLDELIEKGVITEPVTAQIGASNYLPKHFEYVRFMDREQFAKTMDACEIVVTHGGTGVIITAVKKGKKVIAVPRLAMYGEHVDDHQLQLLQQFDELQIICACYDLDMFEEFYKGIREREFRTYVSNTHVIIESIEEYLNELT